jgi:hypothetical protein
VAGSCERGNEPSGCIEYREVLRVAEDLVLLWKDSCN